MALDPKQLPGAAPYQASPGSYPWTVAIVDPFGKHCGLHYYVDALARALSAQGARVLVHVTQLTGVSGREPYTAMVSFGQLYGPDPVWRRGLRYVRGIVRAMLSVRYHGARVVSLHIFNFDFRDAVAAWLAKLLGMKVVLTLHDVENFGKKTHGLMRRLTLAGGDGYILHNQHSRAAFEKVEGNSPKPVAVIPHGHYCDSFAAAPSREQARSDLGLPAQVPIFLFFGNARREKGLDLLIEACGKLEEDTEWRLVIAGKMKPDMYAYYSSLVRAHDPRGRIRVDAKHVSDEETLAYYRAADLVVVPYRSIYESGVTIMAMSLGRAVLVSNLPPLVDSIARGKAGLIFASNDADSLATALRDALKRRDELDEIGSFGQIYVRHARDWMEIGEHMLAFMQDMTNAGK